MSFQPPKIQVYYLIEQAKRSGHLRQNTLTYRFFLPGFLLLTLVVGAIGGGVAVWQSKFGAANKAAESETLLPRGASPSQPIPLSFDESELNVVTDLLPVLIQEYHHE